MKVLLLASVLMLAGCNGRVDPEPVVMVLGDSVSEQWFTTTRHHLCGAVVVQHDSKDGDAPEAPKKSCDKLRDYLQPGRWANDGCAATTVVTAFPRLQPWHYSVIMFDAGLHDTQFAIAPHKNQGISYSCGGPTPLDEYRESLEKIADFLGLHADAVVFIMTTPVNPGNNHNPVGGEVLYNQVLKEVARKHGFYILTFTDVQAKPHDIHLNGRSILNAGGQAAACIETVMQHKESPNCHR